MPSPSKEKINILIVDDRPDGLLAMEAVLDEPQYNVVRAGSGPEALALVRDADYAVILLDVQMPVMNGFETASLIKSYPDCRHIPIIFVTAINKEMGYVYQGYKAGAVDYLFKPFDPEVMRAKVAVFVDLFRMNRIVRRQAEAMRQSEERLSLLIEGVGDYSIYMLDAEGRAVSWSAVAQRMLGYTREEVIGKPFSFIYTLEDQKNGKADADLALARQDGRYENTGWRIHRDGRRLWARSIITPLRNSDGVIVGFAKVVQDLTAQRKTEEELKRKDVELQHARKMEAIGRLAGGVAHDFNNLITGIMGITQDLHDTLPSDSPHREDLQEVIKASGRAFELTKQLLAFGRRQVISPRVLDMNSLIMNLNRMLLRLLGEDIQLTTVLTPSLGPVKADPSQIEQVMVNLLLNSRDAMPNGGRITVSTNNVQFDSNHPHFHHHAQEGPYVALIVEDSGSGMDPQVLANIFEPFFTTKEKGKGTGLGLATVYGIVKQNGGEIFVESQLGKGTIFTIYLPRAAEEMILPPSESPEAVPSAQGETILVVEDEEIVRRVVCRTLARSGYRVLEASDGAHAIELSRELRTPLDAIVTDIVMPGLNGRQVAEAIKGRHPNAVVLYMSGHTEDVITHHGIVEKGLIFIEKSELSTQLLPKIKKLLSLRNGHSSSSDSLANSR